GFAIAHGQFAESERHLTEVLQLGELADDPALGMTLTVHEAMRATLQRCDDEAIAILSRLRLAMGPMRDSAQYVSLFRAHCASRREDLDETRGQLRLMRHALPTILAQYGPRAMACEPIAFAGTDDERRAARTALSGASSEHSSATFTFTYEGPIIRLRALL